jgi:hypothetical protein
MSINTSPTDYRINKQMQMMKFSGERWELFGPIIEDFPAPPAGRLSSFGQFRHARAGRNRHLLGRVLIRRSARVRRT